MSVFYILIMHLFLLIMAIVCYFDTRRPLSTKLRYKYRVKDSSIFRKIIRFKDRKFYPCNYFKIVPIYIYLFLSLINLIFFVFDVVTGFYITNNYQIVLCILFGCIIGVSVIYLITIIVWWELVDYKETKLTKEEKESLKDIKKSFRNKNKK